MINVLTNHKAGKSSITIKYLIESCGAHATSLKPCIQTLSYSSACVIIMGTQGPNKLTVGQQKSALIELNSSLSCLRDSQAPWHRLIMTGELFYFDKKHARRETRDSSQAHPAFMPMMMEYVRSLSVQIKQEVIGSNSCLTGSWNNIMIIAIALTLIVEWWSQNWSLC